MKRRRIYIGAVILTLFPLWSQAQSSMQEALDEIELNNSFLKSMRDEAEAERLANKTNVNLPDPEIGFTHNWYTKGSNLRVKEFSVTQELDWDVITGQRKRISRKKNELVELQYVQDRNGVRLRALQELISLVHATSWLKELKSRENDAATLAEAYQKMLESGKTNVIEANRARLNLVRVANDVKRAETDRQELLNRLKALNGGMELAHVVTEYGNNELPLDFEGWCAEAENVNPELAYVRQTVKLSQQELKQTRTEYIPNLSVGYATEQSPVEGKHALVLGLRIPLWQNHNKLKQSKKAAVAAESREADTRIQLISEMETCYDKARSLKMVADHYARELERVDIQAALRSALMEGQINVLEYTTELEQYYDAREQALNAERDCQMAYAALQAYTWH